MKIAILYIGIGKYFDFWNNFFETSEKKFLVKNSKTYFIFTDNLEYIEKNQDNEKIKCIFQEDLGWPGNTLYRFKMFKKLEEELKGFDYIYFFNSNYIFIEEVLKEEILPIREDFVNLCWSKVNKLEKKDFPYERNKKSQAYISHKDGEYYYQGGMTGAKKIEFLDLIDKCNKMIKEDQKNKIIAINNDESYLNKYFLTKNVKVLFDDFGMPEEWGKKKSTKMILQDKGKILGNSVKKNKKEIYSFRRKIVSKFKKKYYYYIFLLESFLKKIRI